MHAEHVVSRVDTSRTAWDSSDPRPVRIHVTEPTRPLPGRPGVVVSHGTGGSAASMGWWTEALAEAGFVTLAVDHHGNNIVDGYAPQAFVAWWDRPLDLSFALDALPELDLGPIAAAGFSAGGYTAAALTGARVDAGVFTALVDGTISAPPTPEFPDLRSAIERETTAAERADWPERAAADLRDPRVRAAVLLCPALGPMITAESLADVTVPVAVRWAGADTITPATENAKRYTALIPGADGDCAAEEAEHYWFLRHVPEGAPVRDRVAADTVAFLTRHLVGPTDR